MTKQLKKAFDTLGQGDMSTLTGAAMAGRKAIQAVVSDLPPSPERTAIIQDTGAGMQKELMDHRARKGDIDEAYSAALRELDNFTTEQPTIKEIIATAKAELAAEQ